MKHGFAKFRSETANAEHPCVVLRRGKFGIPKLVIFKPPLRKAIYCTIDIAGVCPPDRDYPPILLLLSYAYYVDENVHKYESIVNEKKKWLEERKWKVNLDDMVEYNALIKDWQIREEGGTIIPVNQTIEDIEKQEEVKNCKELQRQRIYQKIDTIFAKDKVEINIDIMEYVQIVFPTPLYDVIKIQDAFYKM